jgi:hypothetical protein
LESSSRSDRFVRIAIPPNYRCLIPGHE